MLKSIQFRLKLHPVYRQVRHQGNLRPTPSNEFKIIYKFPYITKIALINRLKVYQTAVTIAAVPGMGILNQLDMCTVDDILFTSVVGLSGLIPMYCLGYFANKLIGIVYYNEHLNKVKLAYIDFWGRRKDLEVEINDIVPFAEQSLSLTDSVYLKFRRYSSKDVLKLCPQYGILDKASLDHIFASNLK